MKQALDNSGNLVTADAGNLQHARCPYCGAPVLLRRRQHDGKGGVTYFWRHQDHAKLGCPGHPAASQTAVSRFGEGENRSGGIVE